MDQVEMDSKPGKGTVKMQKTIGKRTKGMDHNPFNSRNLTKGMKKQELRLAENTGLVWCIVRKIYGKGNRAGRSVSDRTIGLLKAIDKFD